MLAHEPAEGGLVDRLRVVSLGDLGELLRVAEEEQVASRRAHGHGVGERELACFVDDDEVEGVGKRLGGERPCGAAEHAAAVRCPVAGDPIGAMGSAVPDLDPWLAVGLAPALADEGGVEPVLDDPVEQVLDDGVGLGDDGDPPVVLLHEVPDDLRGGPGLAAPGRALDGDVGAVEGQCSPRDDRDGVPAGLERRECTPTHETRRLAGEQVPCRIHRVVVPRQRRAGVAVERLLDGLGRDRGRRQRDGKVVAVLARPAGLLDLEDVGVVRIRNRDPELLGLPGVLVVLLHSRWRREGVGGIDRRCRRAARTPGAGEPHPPARVRLAPGRRPVADDLGVRHDEHVAVLAPLGDVSIEPAEVVPPERQVLAPVIADGSGEQAPGVGGSRVMDGLRPSGELVDQADSLQREGGSGCSAASPSGPTGGPTGTSAASSSQSRSRSVETQS